MNKNIKYGLITAFVVVSNQALAGDWSVGVLAGKSDLSRFSSQCPGQAVSVDDLFLFPGFCNSEENDEALGINLAYNFNQTFGISSPGGPAILPSYGGFDTSLSTRYLAGTASYSLTQNWSLTGRLGYFDSKIEINDVFGSFEVGGEEEFYSGGSLDYEFAENWSAQLRYDRFDIDVVSFGLKYSFGD